MKKFKIRFIFFLSLCTIIFSSCSKGYEVRFTNYNTEVMDSVIIGNNKIVFTAIEKEATTEYVKLSSGNYNINCITKTKKVYTSNITIPKKDGGKRTIQIDGINAISILED